MRDGALRGHAHLANPRHRLGIFGLAGRALAVNQMVLEVKHYLHMGRTVWVHALHTLGTRGGHATTEGVNIRPTSGHTTACCVRRMLAALVRGSVPLTGGHSHL